MDLVMHRLPCGVKNTISMVFVVFVRREDPKASPPLCAAIFAWLCVLEWRGCPWMERRDAWQHEKADSLVTA